VFKSGFEHSEDNERRRKITDLAEYIENNFNGLYGSRSLKDKVEAKEVLVTCDGAMEKNIDVVIGRRFKKPGMSWTKEGENNILKLRILCYDENGWEKFWGKQKLMNRDEFLTPLNNTTKLLVVS
jgi:hypothetical protein